RVATAGQVGAASGRGRRPGRAPVVRAEHEARRAGQVREQPGGRVDVDRPVGGDVDAGLAPIEAGGVHGGAEAAGAAPRRRLYLRLGDRVFHTDHEEWGEGAVVEEMTSVLEGGTCLVRVMFADGRQRTFHNDLESDLCCYFFGVRKQWRGAAGVVLEPEAPRARAPRRRLP